MIEAVHIMRMRQWLLPAMLRARLATWRRPSAVFLSPGVASDLSPSPDQLVPSHEHALMAWRDWCQAHAGQRCLLGLSSQWLLHALVPVDEAATRAQAVLAAWQQWTHYFNVDAGLDPQASSDAWRVRAVRVGRVWLVGALPGQLVADLMAVAQAHGVALHWMGPWWARGGQHWLKARHLNSSSGPGDSSDEHSLWLREPGWCVGLRKAEGDLTALWAVQDDDLPASRNDALARRVGQVRIGTGRASSQVQPVLWDDAKTRALLEGRLLDASMAEVGAT